MRVKWEHLAGAPFKPLLNEMQPRQTCITWIFFKTFQSGFSPRIRGSPWFKQWNWVLILPYLSLCVALRAPLCFLSLSHLFCLNRKLIRKSSSADNNGGRVPRLSCMLSVSLSTENWRRGPWKLIVLAPASEKCAIWAMIIDWFINLKWKSLKDFPDSLTNPSQRKKKKNYLRQDLRFSLDFKQFWSYIPIIVRPINARWRPKSSYTFLMMSFCFLCCHHCLTRK